MRHFTFGAKAFLGTWICASGLVWAQSATNHTSRDVYGIKPTGALVEKEDAPKVEFTSSVSTKKHEYQLPAGETSNNLARHMIGYGYQATEVGANTSGTNFGTYVGYLRCGVMREGAAVTSSDCVVSKEPPVGMTCSTGAHGASAPTSSDHSNVDAPSLYRGNGNMPSTGGVPRKK